MIKIDALYKRYRKKQVLNSISCKFNVGCTGLLGPNGSGKTTMIKILSGVEKYNSGNILFYNKQEHEIERKKVKIGYLPQNFGTPSPIFTPRTSTYELIIFPPVFTLIDLLLIICLCLLNHTCVTKVYK